MSTISSEMEREIARRLAAGPYRSADELLGDALRALDDSRNAAEAWLESELLSGLAGEDAEMSDDEWAAIERDALNAVNHPPESR